MGWFMFISAERMAYKLRSCCSWSTACVFARVLNLSLSTSSLLSNVKIGKETESYSTGTMFIYAAVSPVHCCFGCTSIGLSHNLML